MPLAGAADRALDLTIAPGYSRLGLAARRRLPDWPAALPSMVGRTVLITGATSGIGLAAATGFAELGARILLVARDSQRGATAAERIADAARGRSPEHHPDVRVVDGDLSSPDSIRACAAGLIARGEPLHVLVHDAGVMAPERTVTDDGLELTFATNALGPFLLTGLLEEPLKASAPARIVTVSSGGMYAQRLDVDDLQSERGEYRPAAVYARSKRAQVVLSELWAARFRGTGVVSHAMHPGWVDTPGIQASLPGFHRLMKPILRSPEEGADTIVWLGAADEPARTSGGFWHDRHERPTYRLRSTRETAADRRRLWETCCALSGWSAPVPAT